MTAPISTLATFGIWLRSKRNFFLFSILGFGIPIWLLEIWLTWEYIHSALWISFLAVVSLGASLLWAFGMWHFFNSKFFPYPLNRRRDQ